MLYRYTYEIQGHPRFMGTVVTLGSEDDEKALELANINLAKHMKPDQGLILIRCEAICDDGTVYLIFDPWRGFV